MLVMHMLKVKKQTPESIISIVPSARIADACALLSTNRIGALVVSSDGATPEGILSERDIVRELGRRGAAVLDMGVDELMTRAVETCHVGDDATNILNRMTQGRFRHLPVIDDGGRMIGLVSIGDAVSGRLAELSAEAEALTGMIMGA